MKLRNPETWTKALFFILIIAALLTGPISADIGSTRPASSDAVETVQADVAAIAASVEAIGTITAETLHEAEEIEHHVHNEARGIGAKASQTATRFADGVGALAVATDDIFYTFEPGNQAVWGDWQQIWGTDDSAAILPAGKQNFYDLHQIKLVDATDDKKNYVMQLAFSTTTYTAALAAGSYTELPLFIEKGDKAPAPSDILTDRQTAATNAWGRILTTDGDNESDLMMQFAVHGYFD